MRLGYCISHYYAFCREFYMKTLIKRLLIWSMNAVWAGVVSYYIPFYCFGIAAVNISGRTEDLWACAFLSFLVLIFFHHG